MSLSLFSCGQEVKDNGPEKPNNLISQEAIIPIIIDLQLLESHYHRTYSRPDVYHGALDSASAIVFADHGVDKVQFEESYAYYAFDIETMYLIYEATLDSINTQISEVGQIQQID